MAECCCLPEKGHAWKESGVTIQGKGEVEVGTLLLSNDQNNVIAENLKYRSHLSGLNNNY